MCQFEECHFVAMRVSLCCVHTSSMMMTVSRSFDVSNSVCASVDQMVDYFAGDTHIYYVDIL